jgi:hypothetical protein
MITKPNAEIICKRLIEHFKLQGTSVTAKVVFFQEQGVWGVEFSRGFTPEELREAKTLALPVLVRRQK